MSFKKFAKTFSALALVAVLALAVVGCEKKQTDKENDVTTAQTGVLTGGWDIYGSTIMDKMTGDELDEFFGAVGEDNNYLTPVLALASQLVNGYNYATLAVGDISSDYVGWNIVTYNVDLEGKSSLISIVPFDIENIKTVENQDAESALGGWTIVTLQKSLLDDENEQDIFDKAMEGYVGLNLTPIQTLARQIVAGTNYMIICTGSPVTADPVEGIYVVNIYEDLEGNVEITSVEQVDLTAYIDN